MKQMPKMNILFNGFLGYENSLKYSLKLNIIEKGMNEVKTNC